MKNELVTDTEIKKNSLFLLVSTKEKLRIYWYRFSRNKLSIAGFILVLTSILLAIFAPVITPFPQHAKAFVDFENASMPPSTSHFFGTDIVGRDLFTRIIFSFRNALMMATIILGISVPVGVTLGLIAGYYYGSWFEIIIMRVTDVFLALPKIVLALAIASVLEPNLTNATIALIATWWTWYTRMVFGMSIAFSKEDFVKYAEIIGAPKAYILLHEILPNCLSPIATKALLDVVWVIMISATLSFVGLGTQPPTPTFGQLIAEGSSYMPDLWWMVVFPACGIAFIVIGFNFFGEGIRDLVNKGKKQ